VMKTSMRNESDDEKRIRCRRGNALADALFTDFEAQVKQCGLVSRCLFSIDLSRIWNTGTRKRMNYSCAG